MDATLEDVTKKTKREPTAEERAAEEMVRRAREQGLSLTGPDGLLKQLTKTVLETALNQELTEHLGHEKHGQPAAGNVRNGTRAKTVLTESTGQVQVQVPRDRDGSFEPQIVKKRQRRLTGVDEIVLSLYAKGLITAEISAHFCCLCRSRAAASASESGCSAGSAWCRTYDPVAGSPRRAGGAGWEIGAPMSDGARRALVTGAAIRRGRSAAFAGRRQRRRR